MSTKSFGDKSTIKGDVYIGMDQSYAGFGITAIDKKGNYYTEVYKAEGTGIERLCNIRNYVEDFLSEYSVVGVAMEGYAFGKAFGASLSGELGGMIKLLLFDLYPGNDGARFPLIIQPTSLKKYITGKGKVDKNQILLSIYKKWDVEFNDDNAADSYGLARIIRNKHDFEYEKEVYDKLTTK
jgi:Holliday junction resolvasome RuvABC endonuclease subunit